MTCKNDSNAVFYGFLCAECYVRDAIEYVRVLPEGEIRLHGVIGPWFPTWIQAAKFTRTLKQEIKEIEEEISLLDFMVTIREGPNEVPYEELYGDAQRDQAKVFRRIAASRREVLKEKKRGMKQ